ncbi:MAG TPA: glycosyltransferase family 39 protein [Thermoanaerobaculia bacterium]|nr:glycosyltransferase family 39 protein [Thermoanaerobaculia bacterium]
MGPYVTSGTRFRVEPLPAASRVLLWALLATAVAVLVAETGHTPFFEPDESRYAEISREMLATGDFVAPHLNGYRYYEKPPLHYWAVAASMSLFGEEEWAARLPVKLSAAGMVLVAVLFARRRFGERVALLAGLIVATSLLVVALARLNIIDTPLSLAVSSAAFAFASFQEHERSGDRGRARAALYLLHFSCAAAVMLKGLVGLVLPGGAILVWALLSRRISIVPRLFSPGPLILFLALVLPWHLAIARRDGEWFDFYVVGEHFRRYFESGHRRDGSPLYFLWALLGGLLPWTPYLGRIAGAFPSIRRGEWRERGGEAYLQVFWILVLLFFSVSQSKLIPYILPVWPAVAVLVALGVERARQRGAPLRPERWVSGLAFGLLAGVVAAYAFGAGMAARYGVVPEAAVATAFLALGALLNLLPARGDSRSPRRPVATERLALTVAAPWIGFVAALVFALPSVARSITPWPLVAVLKRELRPDDLLLQRGHYLQAPAFYTKRLTPIADLEWSELDFGRAEARQRGLYLSDEDFARKWHGPARVLCIVHFGHLRDFGNPALGLSLPHVLAKSPNGKFFLVANRP